MSPNNRRHRSALTQSPRLWFAPETEGETYIRRRCGGDKCPPPQRWDPPTAIPAIELLIQMTALKGTNGSLRSSPSSTDLCGSRSTCVSETHAFLKTATLAFRVLEPSVFPSAATSSPIKATAHVSESRRF
jgi:hypothetical protein